MKCAVKRKDFKIAQVLLVLCCAVSSAVAGGSSKKYDKLDKLTKSIEKLGKARNRI